MQRSSTFDPTTWLSRWKAAGGAWVNTSLILPPPHRRELERMIGDLAPHEIRAVAQHLGVAVEPVE